MNMDHEGEVQDQGSGGHREAVLVDPTPGPWGAFWHEENSRLGLGTWRFVYDKTHALPLLRCKRDNRRAEANARLIAAAPDMLAVLNAARVVLKNRDQSPQEMKLLDAIKIVIAKAEGRS